MTTTHTIPAQNLAALEEHVAKLNKKVTKLQKKGYDVKPITMTSSPAIAEGEKVVFNVTITGEAVQANGWDFIATLQHEEAGTILRSVPGMTVEGELAAYRDAAPACNHCGYQRRRNDTFVVRKGQEYKQVGRNCLADFFGFDPHAAAAMAEILASVGAYSEACEDGEFLGGGERLHWTIGMYLPYVAAVIRNDGWLPKGKAYEQHGHTEYATASVAWRNLIDRKLEKQDPRYVPTEKDAEVAKKAIEFMAEHFDKEGLTLSDYEHNLRVAFLSGIVDPKTAGIVASGINYAAREQEKAANRVDFANSQFVGELKKRMVIESLVCVYPGFGGRPVVFVDPNGNKITAWNPGFAIEKGGTYTVKATPVKHEEYKGIKSTMVNRVVLA